MRSPEMLVNILSETVTVRSYPSQNVLVERTFASKILGVSSFRNLRTSYLKERNERLNNKPR